MALSSSSGNGRRPSTSRNGHGVSNSNPRDKVSRFVFLSAVLITYTGVTLGLMLWNGSGSGTGGGALEKAVDQSGVGGSPVYRNPGAVPLDGMTNQVSVVEAEGLGGAQPGFDRRGEQSTTERQQELQQVSAGSAGHGRTSVGGLVGADRGDGRGVREGRLRSERGASGATGDVGAKTARGEDWRESPRAGGQGLLPHSAGDGQIRPNSGMTVEPQPSPPFTGKFDVTLVSQTSQNRFWMLPFLCKRWPGPISIAILEEDREVLPTELCSRMVISSTAAQSPEELDPVWYPVNRLRNVAVRAVQTSHFLMLDIDMWPDVNAYQALHMRYHLEKERMEDARNAVVFSAFSRRRFCDEDSCLQYANDVPETIADLKPCLESNTCGRFDASNQSGQGTAYVYYWRSMLRKPDQRNLERILCFKSHRFEPYLVVRKTELLPSFDERFLGYGKNKIQWINHLRYSGFSFFVMPVNFVIHAPHPKSLAKASWEKTGGGKQGLGDKLMDQIFDRFMDELRIAHGPEEETVTSLCKERPPQAGKEAKGGRSGKEGKLKKFSKVGNTDRAASKN